MSPEISGRGIFTPYLAVVLTEIIKRDHLAESFDVDDGFIQFESLFCHPRSRAGEFFTHYLAMLFIEIMNEIGTLVIIVQNILRSFSSSFRV